MRGFLFLLFLALASLAYSGETSLLTPIKRDYELRNLEYVGFTPASEHQEALESILRGDEYVYGIPEKLFRLDFFRFSQNKLWELGNIPSELVRPVGKFKKLPLGLSSFERKGEKFVNTNCFSCHAGVVAGKVIAGMPSTNFDPYTQGLQTELLTKWYAKAAREIILNPVQQKGLKGFLDYYTTMIRPVLADTTHRGDNPGPYVVWQTIARLKDPAQGLELVPTGESTSLEKEVLEGKSFPTVNPGPWWNLKYKKRSFWTSDVTHLSPTTFALNLLDQGPENKDTLEERMVRTRTHLDYARSIEAPKYPFPINEQKADEGFALFHGAAKCFKCHGTYSRSGDLSPENYPNIPQKDMGTDPEYARTLHTFGKLYQHAEKLFTKYKEKGFYAPSKETTTDFPEAKGYAPPPLKGIWASAPYFHNGSVPTLLGVLDSSVRPVRWIFDIDPKVYNEAEGGLEYERVSMDAYQDLKKKANPRGLGAKDLIFRRIYDTRDFGRANSGHTVGDKLSPEERAQLLEYLKRL